MAGKAVTQKEIAELLGVSRGTVDRALNDRARISPRTRARVLEKAEELGYYPNRIAQFLSTGKKLHFAVVTPADPFWVTVKQGADSFLSELVPGIVTVNWHRTDVHDAPREVRLLQDVLQQGADGIAIAPADPDLLTPWIDRAVEENIPVITLNTDAPNSKRSCFVGQDPRHAGRVAAELLCKFLMGQGYVRVITAFENVMVHKQRRSSFAREVERSYPNVVVDGVFESRDSPERTAEVTWRIVHNAPPRLGIYLTTGIGTREVARVLEQHGLARRIPVVCFDFLEPTVELLREGIIGAAIGQDPFMQGYQSMKLLYEGALNGRSPPKCDYYTRTDVGLRHTVDLLLRTA